MSEIGDGYYFPLDGFDWDGSRFEINQSARIVPRDGIVQSIEQRFTLPGATFKSEIGGDRYRRIAGAKHWLVVDGSVALEDAESTAALFLWSLWLAASTKVRIRDQVELAEDRLTSRWWTSTYEFNPLSPMESITIKILEDMRHTFPRVMSIYRKRDTVPRLSEAVFLTHLGCKHKNWQAAFILWMSSLETLILEPKDVRGYTFTVCSRIARLLSTSKSECDANYTEMENLYQIRSDIVHGKFGSRAWDTKTPDDRLKHLARLEKVLKRVWRGVLAINGVEQTLERAADRDVFFNQILPSF